MYTIEEFVFLLLLCFNNTELILFEFKSLLFHGSKWTCMNGTINCDVLLGVYIYACSTL